MVNTHTQTPNTNALYASQEQVGALKVCFPPETGRRAPTAISHVIREPLTQIGDFKQALPTHPHPPHRSQTYDSYHSKFRILDGDQDGGPLDALPVHCDHVV